MLRRSFISSAVLHGVVITLMAMDFSFAKFDHTPPPSAILMVDLTKVKIADKTNLPPKVTPKKEVKKAPPQPEKPKTVATKVQTKVPDPPKPKPVPQTPVKEAAPVIEKKDTSEPPKPKKEATSAPKDKPKTPAKPSTDETFKSLLASVDKVRQSAPAQSVPQEPEETRLTDGIEGGTEGILSQILTISERDLIASQLSKCWNLDAGKKDIENIIIEIRAQVSKDGRIKEVEILNKMLDSVQRSVADSAKRAVLICDKKGDESPFKMLAEKYADHYGDWKTMTLRFNPLTGGVM